MEQLVLDDFSGGINNRPDPTVYSPRQWRTIEGMVLEDDGNLRSQWVSQRVGTAFSGRAIAWFRSLRTEYNRFGIVGCDDGTVWYMVLPLSGVDDAAGAVLAWTQLAGIDADVLPVAEVVVPNQNTLGHQMGLLLHNDGYAANTNAYIVYESADGVLSADTYTEFYPPDIDTDAIPKAQTGCMWDDRLVLAGNVEWAADEDVQFAVNNRQVRRSYIWLSEAGQVTRFDPLSVYAVGSPEGKIVGVFPIDAGLLVFKDGPDGVWLLRGTASNFSIEPLHTGVAVWPYITYWGYTNTVCWIDATGQIWHTNGSDVLRLDGDQLVWGRPSQEGQSIVGFGPYVVVSRGGELWAMAGFPDDSAAWTKLDTSWTSGTPFDLFASGDQMYFVANDGAQLYRFNRRTENVSWERGETPVGPATNRVVSAPLSALAGRHRDVAWHRVGYRMFNHSETACTPHVDEFTSWWQPALAPDFTPSPQTAQAPAGEVFRRMVPMFGPSHEASVEWTCLGDVTLYDLEVWFTPGKAAR